MVDPAAEPRKHEPPKRPARCVRKACPKGADGKVIITCLQDLNRLPKGGLTTAATSARRARETALSWFRAPTSLSEASSG